MPQSPIRFGAEAWWTPRAPGVSRTRGDGALSVHIERDSPVYVSLNRKDLDFRVRPERSSFPLTPGETYDIGVAVTCSEGLSCQIVLVEYYQTRDRVIMTHGLGTIHRVALGASALTVTIRLSGRGEASIGETRIALAAPNPAMPSAALRNLAGVIEELAAFLREGEHPAIVIQSGSSFLGSGSRIVHRAHFFARALIARGRRVVLIPFGEVPDEHRRPEAGIFQVGRSRFGLLRDALAATDRPGIFCFSLADIHAVAAADLLRRHGWRVVYDMVDDMEDFRSIGFAKWYHPRIEERALRRSHRVVAVNRRLASKARVMGASRVDLVPNGVAEALVVRGAPRRTLEAARTRRGLRRVGFIGHLTPAWFDWTTLMLAARAMPDVTFEIIGEGGAPPIELPGNVALLGARNHDQFFDISAGWSIGLIPFRPIRTAAAMDPLKIYEYLAVGLRVVAIMTGDWHTAPRTFAYARRSAFEATLKRALSEEVTEAELAPVEPFLAASTWQSRAQAFLEAAGA